ncbi:ATP-binding protein [Guyparkeria halophila]|uniref:ATP-binding protein n=1 Tax=Guyparkeria halophila TaxID=47960 RepID=A0ABZ0YYL1_9GAMM|nr:ATP-binding protein [Guyparkeria halophila]WQH16265.1 ATP-binding protein [Guyparkeria halophila]
MTKDNNPAGSHSDLPYQKTLIPGVLSIHSSFKKLTGFPLCTKLEERPNSTLDQPFAPIQVAVVQQDKNTNPTPSGKEYKADGLSTHIRTPFGRLFSLDAEFLKKEGAPPTIAVNSAYKRLANLTVGNVSSLGWLARDLVNIALLERGYALLHAAALTFKGRTILLVGLSNTGKTTTALKFAQNLGAKLYGDDLVATDGRQLFPCPHTALNIPTNSTPGLLAKTTQLARTIIPFYENFGPEKRHTIEHFVGRNAIASPSPCSDIVFLKRSANQRTELIEKNSATAQLSSSNRVEFTYYDNPLINAHDFLHNQNNIPDAEQAELRVIGQLVDQSRNILIKGQPSYFEAELKKILMDE